MMARKKAYYAGVRMAPYDLLKEALVALGVVTVLVVVFAAVLSSPDEKPLTLQSVATTAPDVYTSTALGMLDGTGAIASYGPPYNNGSGSVQYIGPVSIQKLIGVHIPVDTAQEYVIGPLSQAAATDPRLQPALTEYNQASSTQQTKWTDNYTKALSSKQAQVAGSKLTVPPCDCGPVPLMMASLLKLGQSGAMDGLLLAGNRFYQTDYTRPLLFMQNDAVAQAASKWNLQGSQWGVMNETGNYPGQAWLWLYTMLYQIAPYNTAWAANTDALAILTVSILSLILLLLPWIPGLNRLPRYLGVYRIIWRDYYREERDIHELTTPGATPVATPEAGS